jgi:hypothetical protein
MSRRAKIAAVAVLGLLWLCTLHVTVPLAGQVPVAVLVLWAEAAVLAVIGAGIARSLGWQLVRSE